MPPATFQRINSILKEVFYHAWQNKYPNLKPTSQIKLKLFLWTKLLENLLLAKYLVSVAEALRPPKPTYMFVWDVKQVLDFVKEKFGDNDNYQTKN